MDLKSLEDKIKELSKSFFKQNLRYWSKKKRTKKIVLIEAFNDTNTHMMTSSIIANAINEVYSFTPTVLINKNQYKDEHKNIFQSFCISNHIFFDKRKIKLSYLMKSFIDLFQVVLFCSKKEKFLKFKKNGILLGDLVYDEYIRRDNNYKNTSLVNLKFVEFFLKFMIKFYFFEELFKKNDVKYVILSHRVYSISVLHRLALINNAKSIISRITSIRVYDNSSEMMVNEYKPTKEILDTIMKKKLSNHISDYLEKRFKGEIDQHDVRNAFVNKKHYTKQELLSSLNINNDNPVVFIMPHAFSDANHSNEFILFNDYYSWFVDTLDKIEHINNINWIVKPHPSSMMYNEVGEVKEIVNSYSGHIKLVPDDLSTSSIFNIAKTVVTISGTVGIEAACMGIKPLIAGDATYRGFDIAVEPNSKEEYFNILENIKHYSFVANEKEKNIARAIIYWLHEASFINSKIFQKKSFLPGSTNKDILYQKIDFYNNILMSIENNNPKEDNFYQTVKEIIQNNDKYNKLI